MQSNEYEYYSDSSIEEINEHPSDALSIYKDITNSLRKFIKQKPLSNDLSLSDAIKSRITVLKDLYVIIFKRYKYDLNSSYFLSMIDELTDAIYGISKIADCMERMHEAFEYSVDSSERYFRLFPSPLDEYVNDTRRNIINEFNYFISDFDWLLFVRTVDDEMRRLPLLDELKIPEDLI